MSHEISHLQQKESEPTQAVRDEAAKIIGLLDGRQSQYFIDNPDHDKDRAITAREALIKDSQTMSPQDMKDLMKLVMDGENHKKGYDLGIRGHYLSEIRDEQTKIDQLRQNLGMQMTNCTVDERREAFAKFKQYEEHRMTEFKKETIVQLTHYSTPPENGEKGRSPGADIKVAVYKPVNTLPIFNIVGDGK